VVPVNTMICVFRKHMATETGTYLFLFLRDVNMEALLQKE